MTFYSQVSKFGGYILLGGYGFLYLDGSQTSAGFSRIKYLKAVHDNEKITVWTILGLTPSLLFPFSVSFGRLLNL